MCASVHLSIHACKSAGPCKSSQRGGQRTKALLARHTFSGSAIASAMAVHAVSGCTHAGIRHACFARVPSGMNPKLCQSHKYSQRPGRPCGRNLVESIGCLQEEAYQSTGNSITWPILSSEFEFELTDTKMVEFVITPSSGVQSQA